MSCSLACWIKLTCTSSFTVGIILEILSPNSGNSNPCRRPPQMDPARNNNTCSCSRNFSAQHCLSFCLSHTHLPKIWPSLTWGSFHPRLWALIGHPEESRIIIWGCQDEPQLQNTTWNMCSIFFHSVQSAFTCQPSQRHLDNEATYPETHSFKNGRACIPEFSYALPYENQKA